MAIGIFHLEGSSVMCIHPQGTFETSIRLHRDRKPRTVRIVLATRLDELDRLAPEQAVNAFFAAAEIGLFGRGTVSKPSHRVELRRADRVMTDTFEATFSRIAPRPFAALAGMVAWSVPGMVRLEIHELAGDERTPPVRDLEPDPDATLLDVRWTIGFVSPATPRLVVRFRERPTRAAAERTALLLRVWTDMVCLGAYAPPDGSAPRAVLRSAEPGQQAEEIVADFEALACAHEAFDALFEAVDAIHEEEPIETVSIPYRQWETTPAKRPAADLPSRPCCVDTCGGLACG